jgi:hypothetical protein
VYCSCHGLLNFLYVAADFCEFKTDHTTEQVGSGNSVDVVQDIPGWNAGWLTSCHELWLSYFCSFFPNEHRDSTFMWVIPIHVILISCCCT